MTSSVDSLPSYLKKYCVVQHGDRYSPRDHASWRYIMRQSRSYFKDHAVPVYLDGLKQTGITLDRIPLIAEMDQKLRELGWGAVPVCGFIPPGAFLEFQARKILPIAYDMRTVEHIAYTPAPDIVHEAAGHAPILADAAYSEYLTMYGAMAQKVIFSKEDINLYEAIRELSDLKENPDSTPAMIAAAEAGLKQATGAITYTSEASEIARMSWWTIEYGLLGSLQNPKIYGAGLLSSVGESQNCLSERVKKIRLSLDCVNTSYDITEPQPQLFVADDMQHMSDVLREFEATLSFRRGGTYGLACAKQGETITTTVLDSGIQISGVVTDYLVETGDQVVFLKFGGACQLAVGAKELPGQGKQYHPQGFSTPIGAWKGAPGKDPSRLDQAALRELGVVVGSRATLEFKTGFVVEGRVAQLVRDEGRLVLIKWQDCTVKRGAETFFQPAWGDFDMAVGLQVVSVFGGPADREAYGGYEVGEATTSPARTSPYTAEEKAAFARYQALREKRAAVKSGKADAATLVAEAEALARNFKSEWLLRLESLELAHLAQPNADEQKRIARLSEQLTNDNESSSEDIRWLIRQGLALAAAPD